MSLPICPKCGCQLEVKLIFASGPKKATMRPSEPTRSASDIGDLLDEAEMRDLNAWEKEFITGLRARYEDYGERVKLSDKQQEILEKIATGRKD